MVKITNFCCNLRSMRQGFSRKDQMLEVNKLFITVLYVAFCFGFPGL